MTKKLHNQGNHRWFSSEILFVSAADMVRCASEIRNLVGDSNRIDIHPGQTGIHLDGYFDISNHLDQIKEIIKEHSSFAMPEYSIKCVLIDQDGYFSGWCEKYNRNGEIIEGINLSEFFEEGTRHIGSAKGDPDATK